jgi:hypothetical protein
LYGILVLALLLIAATLVFWDFAEHQWRLLWLAAGGLALAIILVYRRAYRTDWLFPPVVYMVIFWLFHFGLVFPAALRPELLFSMSPWYSKFFTSPEAGKAVIASLLFLTAFAWGVSRRSPRLVRLDVKKTGRAPELALAGWVVIAFGLVLLATFLANHGIRAFFLPYSEYFEISNTPTYAIFIISFGLILLAAGGISVRAILATGLLTYFPLFLLMMAAGSRTGPLFSVVVLVIIMNLRGIRIPRFWLAAGGLGILVVIATVRDVRSPGLASARATPGTISVGDPISGMTELGGSLCPVIATADYMGSNPYLYGASYVYPFYRQGARALGRDPGSPDTDVRFIARYITRIYGAVGYSTVAEAYANGGLIAVALFAAAWGLALGLLMRNAGTPYGAALLAAVLIPMMSNIRNSFIYVPAWIFLAAVPLMIMYLFRRGISKNRLRETLASTPPIPEARLRVPSLGAKG